MRTSFPFVLTLAMALLWTTPAGYSQEKPQPGKYEYAVVKWDGPDRLFYNLPGKFEVPPPLLLP